MECLLQKTELTNTFNSIRTFSFQEKKSSLIDEEKINVLLDTILEFKKEIKEKTSKIDDVNESIEKLTWFNDLNDDCLMLLNDLISATKDLYTSLIRQYDSMHIIRKKDVAKEEIKDFKNSIDVLRESYEDLESVFFYLPKMPEFIETTKKISLI
jgi:predicted nuclease with TOPRIM domain